MIRDSNNTIKKCLSLLVLSLLLSGCNSNLASKKQLALHGEHGVSNSDSHALQVMNADGRTVGLKDVPYDSSADAALSALNAAQLTEHLLGSPSSMPGISSSGMSMLFMLNFLNDETIHTRKSTWMPVWMPGDLAENEQQAQVELSKIMEHAIGKALGSKYKVKPYEWTNTAVFGAQDSNRVLRVDGPKCEQWSCLIRGSLSPQASPKLNFGSKVVKSSTPSFIKHGQAHSYRYRGLAGFSFVKVIDEFDEKGLLFGSWHKIKVKDVKDFDYADFQQQLSAHLPEWAYIYVGPQMPYNKLKVPYVLNQGQLLLFMKQQQNK
ncbi:MAG: hypothetical protein ACTMHT_03035 [Oceanisphaera sp.]